MLINKDKNVKINNRKIGKGDCMEKEKNTKILSIVALFIAALCLTVGFAAFSNTLTISSSATVTPNKEDFNFKIYGIGESFDSQTILNNPYNKDLYKYETSSPVFFDGGALTPIEYEVAQIDNTTYTISNIAITVEEPLTTAIYPFMIENTGNYDAYINFAEYDEYLENVGGGKSGTCTAAEGTTESLMNEACEHILEIMGIADKDGNDLTTLENYKLNKGEHIFIILFVTYGDSGHEAARADGDFTVKFDDIKFDFSTVAK